MDLLSAESFKDTFGSKKTRKRPRLDPSVDGLDALLAKTHQASGLFLFL
jgi:hypothetical protein